MNRTILLLLITILGLGCTQRDGVQSDKIFVTIPPLKGIVEAIVEDDIPIEVILPAGASPEMYELSAKQMVSLQRSKLIFSTSLMAFEEAILSNIEDPERVVNLSEGIALLEGSCSHAHHAHSHSCNHSHHTHGVDPHIWTSPKCLLKMSENAYLSIAAQYPDSVKYTKNYEALRERLASLDSNCESRIKASGIDFFIIYHPALTYYADDYGIEQIAIEAEGKEPSAKRLAELIDRARESGLRSILYQRQYPISSVEAIANDIGAECVEIDPLREDVIENITDITHLLTKPQ